MHFEPAHFPFDPPKGEFKRGQFFICPRVLIMILPLTDQAESVFSSNGLLVIVISIRFLNENIQHELLCYSGKLGQER